MADEDIQWDQPSTPEETIQWSMPSAAEEHQMRVESYGPEAEELAKKMGVAPAMSGNIKNVPFVGPLLEKGSAYAVAATGVPLVEGSSTAERYRNIMARNEAIDEALKRNYPIASKVGTATDIASGVFMTPELGVAEKLAKAAPITLKYGSKIAGPSIEGAGYAGAAGLMEGPPGETVEEKIKRVGPEMAVGAAAPHVVRGIIGTGAWAAGGVKNMVADIFNPEGGEIRALAEEAKKIPGKASAAGLTPEEYAAAVARGDDVSLLDLQGAQRRVAHAAERLPEDENIRKINVALQERLDESSARLRNDVDIAFKTPIDANAIRTRAVEEARLVNDPAYKSAYAVPIDYASPVGQKLENIVNNRVPATAIKRANELMRTEGKQSQQILADIADDGTITLKQMPDTMQIDYITRALNDLAKSGEGAGAMGGINQLGAAYQNLSKEIRENLKIANPAYKDAVEGAGRYINQNNAFDAGIDFFNLANVGSKASDPKLIGAQLAKFDKYTPEEKEMMAQGLASYIKENPSEAARVFAKNDKVTMDRYRAILGNDRFNQIDDSLRLNRLAAMTKEIGNASQRKNIYGPAMAGGIAGIAALALESSPQIFQYAKDNPLAATGVLTVLGLAGAVKAGRSIQGDRKAAALLAMAASDNPEISKKILAASQKDARVRVMLRNLEGQVARTYAAMQESGDNTDYNREGRASGGRVGRLSAQSLLSDLKRRKIMLANKTEQMLSLPDDAVVQALDAAKR